MLPMILARLSRVVPLLIVLAVIAIVAYFVMQYKYSPPRAKRILIKAFSWITGIISAFFALACLYALLDGNKAVLELFATFLAAILICFAITRICHTVFVRHYPEYKRKAQKTTGTERFPWFGKHRRQ